MILQPFIRNPVSVLMRFRDVGTVHVHQILCKSRKKYIREPGNDETSARERKYESYTESPKSPAPNKARPVKIKVKSILITFLWHEGECSQRIRPGRPQSRFRILF
jgi:hypothetical protein